MSVQLGRAAQGFEQEPTAGRMRLPEWLGSSAGVLEASAEASFPQGWGAKKHDRRSVDVTTGG